MRAGEFQVVIQLISDLQTQSCSDYSDRSDVSDTQKFRYFNDVVNMTKDRKERQSPLTNEIKILPRRQ